MTDERAKLLEAAISQIEKSYGKGSIMRLGSKDVLVPVNVIPSGCLSLDAALGVGGFPRGRVIEVYGPESGGKTTRRLCRNKWSGSGSTIMLSVECPRWWQKEVNHGE